MSVYGIHAKQESPHLFQAETPREAERQEAGKSASAPVSTTDYFFGLQEQFPGLAISVGTGQAESGLNNVAISPLMLEKMAADPDIAADYESRLTDIEQATAWLQKQYAADGMTLTAHGTVIESNGNVTSWSKTAPLSPSHEPEGADNAFTAAMPLAAAFPSSHAEKNVEAPAPEAPAQAAPLSTPVPSLLLAEEAPSPSAAHQAKAAGNGLYSRYLQHDGRYDAVPNKGSLLRIAG